MTKFDDARAAIAEASRARRAAKCPACGEALTDDHDPVACAEERARHEAEVADAVGACTPAAPCGLGACEWCASPEDWIPVMLPRPLLARVLGLWDVLLRVPEYRDAPPRRAAAGAARILLSQGADEVERLVARAREAWGDGWLRERAEAVARAGRLFAPVTERPAPGVEAEPEESNP